MPIVVISAFPVFWKYRRIAVQVEESPAEIPPTEPLYGGLPLRYYRNDSPICR